MSPLKLAAVGALFITFAGAASAATNWMHYIRVEPR